MNEESLKEDIYSIDKFLENSGELGRDIYENKYRFNNETFIDFLFRVSNGTEQLAKLIAGKKFLPAGRILSNRGLDKYGIKVTLSNCYVATPPEDNIESIYETCGKLARTFSYGGGIGVDISKLAPDGAKVNNTSKKSSGAVSFVETFAQVPKQIGQNGRRGALMISLDCTHPDLEEFIKLKTDPEKATSANLSIRVNEEFMDAVKEDKEFELYFKREETGEEIKKTIKAREVFRTLAESNWRCGEPGILYWDNFNDNTMLSNMIRGNEFEFAGVNPCGEQCLPSGGSCLLGAMNLSEYVLEPFTTNATFAIYDFQKDVKTAVIALNDVLEEGLLLHPLKEQRESVKKWKQIGLGIMGLADMLIKMGYTYGDKKSLELCDTIGSIMADTAICTSANIAKEKKGSFTNSVRDLYNIRTSSFFENNTSPSTTSMVSKYGLHNSQLLSIAPTGSISNLIGVSGGIEPIFAFSYERKTESLHGETKYYKVYTPIVKEYMEKFGITDEKDLPEYFVTANDIPYKNRLKMQAVWQKHIDASISSTVNVPNEFTVDDVMNLYIEAHDMGLKGVTIFRAGCERDGVLTVEKKEELKNEVVPVETTQTPLKRGEIVHVNDEVFGLKRKLTTGCGTIHLNANFDFETGEIREVFPAKGSEGGCNNFMNGLSRVLSAGIRGGIPLEVFVDQLNSTGTCPSYRARRVTKHDVSPGNCCPMAIGRALQDMQKDAFEMAKILNEYYFTKPEKVDSSPTVSTDTDTVEEPVKTENKRVCPDCGSELLPVGGCYECLQCGYTKCS